LRKSALAAAVLALVAMFGAYGPVAAAQTSSAKIVIIVGADTPQYLDDADQVYAEAIQYTPNVTKVYSPNATWAAVYAATTGANIVVYLGHGNGWPSPYTYDPSYTTKDGFGLNSSMAGTHGNLKYYGEPSIRTLRLAPNALILLFHLCYASGNSEPGNPAPSVSVARQRVDNYGAAFLAAGASAVIADGHSHSGYYLRALFSTNNTLDGLWRGASNYHGNDINFTPTRSTGRAILDPDNGDAAPSGFYRSIVGNLGVTSSTITGIKPPPGVIGVAGVTVVPSRNTITTTGTASPIVRRTTTPTSTATTPTRNVTVVTR
jgi:hypothetical protein